MVAQVAIRTSQAVSFVVVGQTSAYTNRDEALWGQRGW